MRLIPDSLPSNRASTIAIKVQFASAVDQTWTVVSQYQDKSKELSQAREETGRCVDEHAQWQQIATDTERNLQLLKVLVFDHGVVSCSDPRGNTRQS